MIQVSFNLIKGFGVWNPAFVFTYFSFGNITTLKLLKRSCNYSSLDSRMDIWFVGVQVWTLRLCTSPNSSSLLVSLSCSIRHEWYHWFERSCFLMYKLVVYSCLLLDMPSCLLFHCFVSCLSWTIVWTNSKHFIYYTVFLPREDVDCTIDIIDTHIQYRFCCNHDHIRHDSISYGELKRK